MQGGQAGKRCDRPAGLPPHPVPLPPRGVARGAAAASICRAGGAAVMGCRRDIAVATDWALWWTNGPWPAETEHLGAFVGMRGHGI